MALEMVRFWQPSLAVEESWNSCWATKPNKWLPEPHNESLSHYLIKKQQKAKINVLDYENN